MSAAPPDTDTAAAQASALENSYARWRTLPNTIEVWRKATHHAPSGGTFISYRALTQTRKVCGAFALHTGPGARGAGSGHIWGNYSFGNNRTFAQWLSVLRAVPLITWQAE